jgi:CRISPR/Cas system-associated protein endoribonuclease Cas2
MRKREDGWVYFIKNGKYYKIGKTGSSITKRISNYKTHNPYKISVLCLIYVEDCILIEKCLHEEYFKKEKHGTDWKELSEDDVKNVLSSMYHLQEKYNHIPKWVDVV